MFAREPMLFQITFWLSPTGISKINVLVGNLFHLILVKFASGQSSQSLEFFLKTSIKVFLKIYDIYFFDKFIELLVGRSSLQRQRSCLKSFVVGLENPYRFFFLNSTVS